MLESLFDSFVVLREQPKLFLPKIFLALLWGSLLLYMVFLVSLMQQAVLMPSAEILDELFFKSMLALAFFVVFFVFDSVINAAFPLMVKKFLEKKSFSVIESIKEVMKNFWKIVLPIIFSFILALIVLLPFTLFFSFSFVSGNPFFLLVSGLLVLIVGFMVSVAFYFVYPVS